MPSYSRWATDIVRLGLKPSLRLASCCSVLVVNGGAGLRLLLRTLCDVTVAAGRAARPRTLGRGLVRDGHLAAAHLAASRNGRAVDAHQLAVKGSPRSVPQDGLERPVLARREGLDLALALHHQAHGDRLDAAGGEAAADLAREQRAERVADQAVHDAPRLLGVHEVHVDVARVREGLADGALGDLAEGHPARLGIGDLHGLDDVPGDGLALAVEVGGEVDGVRAAAARLMSLTCLRRSSLMTYSGAKSCSTSTPSLPLPGFSGRSRTWPYEARTL